MPKSKSKRRSNSKSGFIGVSKKTYSEKYEARIRIDGKQKCIGSSYDTAIQAAKAYDKKAIKLRRPLHFLNYPKKTPVGYTPIQRSVSSRSIVGYRGVSKNGKKFQAMIKIGGKNNYLGTHKTAKEAAIAYDRFVLKAHPPTMLLNFPDMVHNVDDQAAIKAGKKKSKINIPVPVIKKKQDSRESGSDEEIWEV